MSSRSVASLLCGALAVFCLPAHADSWTTADNAREAVYLALVAVDWGQTLDLRHRADLQESNPVLGLHPSRSRVNSYFLANALLHPVIAHYLPGPWRAAFQYVSLGVEVGAVSNNARLGIRITF